jgi:hypothetical protein
LAGDERLREEHWGSDERLREEHWGSDERLREDRAEISLGRYVLE